MSAEELFSQQTTVPEREKQVKIGYSVLLTMDSPVYPVFLHAVNHKFRRGSLRKKYPGLQSIRIVEESKKDMNGIATVEFRAYGVISWGLFRALLLDSLFQGMNNQIFFSNANPVWGSLTDLSPD